MSRIATLKSHLMKDDAFAAEYAKADEEFGVVEALIAARRRAGLSQAEVAARMGTKQSAVARIEGRAVSPTVETLEKYAAATHSRLTVRLEPIGG